MLLATQMVAACTFTANPTAVPTATPQPWTAVDRPSFSLALPPNWRIVDLKSSNLSAQYGALTSENPDFATFAPLEGLRQFPDGADVLAFDFAPGRTSPGFFTVLIVSSETLESEQRSQNTRNYLYELRGATNFTTTNMRVGNTDGKRLSVEYPLRRSAEEVLNGLPPAPGAELLRETSFVAYPAGAHYPAPGLIRLTFISRAEQANAYELEWRAIADRLLAKD